MRAPAAEAWVRNRLIAGSVLLFAGRLALSLWRSGPVLVADEIGYLTNARVLAGGIPGQLERAPYYRGGYSLLVAPLLKLTSDPTVAYHIVLALNAALAASLLVLLYVLLTRCAGVQPRAALWAALAGALYPSVTVFSQAALSENALFPLTCAWLIAVCEVLVVRGARRRAAWGAAVGASAAGLWAVHGRMIAAVALTVALAAWLAMRAGAAARRGRLTAAAIVLAVLAAGLWGTHVLNSHLLTDNYGGHAVNEANSRIGALIGLHPLLTAVSNLAGQLWYLLASTFGLLVVVVVRAFAGRGRPAILVWLLALTGLLLLVSAGAFPTRSRPDMLIYGRYAEVVAPPLVALGVAALSELGSTARARALSLTLAALAVLTVVVVSVRVTAGDHGIANRWNVASLPFVTFELGAGVLIGAAAVGLAAAWLLNRIARAGKPLGLAMAALFLPIVIYGAANPILHSQRSVYTSGWRSPEPVAGAHRMRAIAYDLADYDVIGLYTVQWFLPHTRVELFDARRASSPAPYVLSGRDWPRRHPGTAAIPLWSDPGRDQSLWLAH